MMKYIFTLITVLLISSINASSEEIEITLGAAYANDVWYDFDAGVVKMEPYDNWDVAFQSVSGPSAGIWTNSQKGIMLYVVPNSNEDSWEDPLDTTGMSANWQQGNNSIETWGLGAFNLGMEGLVTGGDYGWGSYNMTTHAILGNKVFIMKLADKTFIKVMIESLLGGTYSIKWADLDGNNEKSKSISKAAYSTKLFAYLDIKQSVILDREPEATSWALLFGKYTDLISMGGPAVPYNVTGVRTNPYYRTSKVQGLPSDEVYAPIITDEDYSTIITTVGSSWKKFNMSTYAYDVVDSLAFFVTKEANEVPDPIIHKLVFTSFEGTETGKLTFKLDEYVTSVNDSKSVSNLRIIPSIAERNSTINIVTDFENPSDISISIFNVLGNLVQQNNINVNNANIFELSLPNLSSGLYYLKLDNGQKTFIETIIIK